MEERFDGLIDITPQFSYTGVRNPESQDRCGRRHGGDRMTKLIEKNLQEHASNIQTNLKSVEERVPASVGKANKGIVISIAKYKEALDKLSKE